jgi:hypothetical protein
VRRQPFPKPGEPLVDEITPRDPRVVPHAGRGERRFIGAIKEPWSRTGFWGARASWPLAELLIQEGTAQIRLRSALLRAVFRGWLPVAEVPLQGAVVEPITGPLWTRGVRFHVPDGRVVMFWCFRQPELLSVLEEAGAMLATEKRLGLIEAS